MKIKLDENMPARLVERLSAAGHDTDTVQPEGLSGQPDDNVWQAAQDSGRSLITQDLDFSDLRKYQPGKHHGLLLVRLANPSRRALVKRVSTLFATEDVESWRRCFVVATERKIRMRGLPSKLHEELGISFLLVPRIHSSAAELGVLG